MIRAHFQIRKEMDDKLRLERNSLKSALDASHASDLDKAVEAAKKEVERDAKANEKVLKDDNDRFQLQIQTLQREVNALNQKIIDAVNQAVKEGDKKVNIFILEHSDMTRVRSSVDCHFLMKANLDLGKV